MVIEYTERIAVRVSKQEKQQIEQLIEKGKATNLSQVTRTALREFMNQRSESNASE